jgi:hypothetical protein
VVENNRDAFDMVRLFRYVAGNDGRLDLTKDQMASFRAESTREYVRERPHAGLRDALLVAANENQAVDLAVAAAQDAVVRDDIPYLRDFCRVTDLGEDQIATVAAIILPPPVTGMEITPQKRAINITQARDWKPYVRKLVREKRKHELKCKPTVANGGMVTSVEKLKVKELAAASKVDKVVGLDLEYLQRAVSPETYDVIMKRLADIKRSEIGDAKYNKAIREIKKVVGGKDIRVLWPAASSLKPWPDLFLTLTPDQKTSGLAPCLWACGRCVPSGQCTEDRKCFFTLIGNMAARGQEPNDALLRACLIFQIVSAKASRS